MLNNDPKRPCPWCSGTNTVLIQPAVSVYKEVVCDSYGCRTCGIFFSPLPEGLEINYASIQENHAFYRAHKVEASVISEFLRIGKEPVYLHFALAFMIDRWDKRHQCLLRYLLQAASEETSLEILEIGCNYGYIGGISARLGHHYLGVDVQEEAIASASMDFEEFGAEYMCVSNDWMEEQMDRERRFDVVYSSEVIEHVPNPRRFLESMVGMCRAGGTVILTTPDLEQVDTRDGWGTDLPPIHTIVLTKSAVVSAMQSICPGSKILCYNEDIGPNINFLTKFFKSHKQATPIETKKMDPVESDFVYRADQVTSHFPPPRSPLSWRFRARTRAEGISAILGLRRRSVSFTAHLTVPTRNTFS